MAPRTGVLLVCSVAVLLVASLLADGRSPPFPSASQMQAYEEPLRTDALLMLRTVLMASIPPKFCCVPSERAIEVGTDFIETDILATKDGQLFCFHDVTLDATTEVANSPQFVDRSRTNLVQGANCTGFFAVDSTLEEIQARKVYQCFSDGDPYYNGKFGILTFEK